MNNGADPMIPNKENKESAFHYCGKSGNSEVKRRNVDMLFAQFVIDIYFSRL